MALHTAYKATCKDDRGIVRWYFGITRVDAGQSAIGAVAARRRWCEALPVSHFKTGLLETLKYTPLGHLLKLEHALAEEALLTAEAMRNRELGHCFMRGGPWHGWQLGYKNNEESRKVAGIVYRWRDDRKVARAEVLAYAKERPDTSSLRRHIENRPFVRDSAEPGRLEKFPEKRIARGQSGPSKNGNIKRQRKGLKYGTSAYAVAAWGVRPAAVRSASRRRTYVRKRPSAHRYVMRSMKAPTWC